MIVVAVYVLIIAHPGPVFGNLDESKIDRADMPVESVAPKQSA